MRSRLLYRGPVTGFADTRTSAAIVILQQRLGVAADGVFGPQTRGRLFPYGTPVLGKRLLTVGDKGYDVALLRVELALHGFPSGRFSSALTSGPPARCCASSAGRGSRRRRWPDASPPERCRRRPPSRRGASPGRSQGR